MDGILSMVRPININEKALSQMIISFFNRKNQLSSDKKFGRFYSNLYQQVFDYIKEYFNLNDYSQINRYIRFLMDNKIKYNEELASDELIKNEKFIRYLKEIGYKYTLEQCHKLDYVNEAYYDIVRQYFEKEMSEHEFKQIINFKQVLIKEKEKRIESSDINGY